MVASALLQKSIPGVLTGMNRYFADQFFAQVDADDFRQLTTAQITEIVQEQLKLLPRKRFETKVSFTTHNKKGMSWSERQTYINMVTDDMAFLVDSVAAYLTEKRLAINLLLHPQLSVAYDNKDNVSLDPKGSGRQSHIHIILRGALTLAQQDDIRDGLRSIAHDVRDGTRDWQAMRLRAIEAKQYIANTPAGHFTREEITEYSEFLDYIYDNNFTFLGCRSYAFVLKNGEVHSTIIKGSGLGVLNDDRKPAYISETGQPLPPAYQKLRTQMPPLYISKMNRLSTVHRRVPLDAITVHHFNEQGQVIGETIFVGLFTSVTYSRSLRSIPYLRYKADVVIKMSGFESASHDGRALRHILEKYPRDELFQTTISDLQRTCASILRLQERQRIALYCRKDLFGRYVSCLVYVPRGRYDTSLRLSFQGILENELGGKCTNFTSSVDDSPLVRVLYTISVSQTKPKKFNPEDIECMLQDAGRIWGDSLADTLHRDILEDARADHLTHEYSDAFSVDYSERYSLTDAVRDIEKIEQCLMTKSLQIDLQQTDENEKSAPALKLYTRSSALILSDVLPVLEHMGLQVMTEHPFIVQPRSSIEPVIIQDFTLNTKVKIDFKALKPIFETALSGIFAGIYADDSLNALTLTAGLPARDVDIIRTYVRYLRQAGLPFSLSYLEQAVTAYPNFAATCVSYFYRAFDPNIKIRKMNDLEIKILEILDQVVSLDQDRILRAFYAALKATRRTNFFQIDTAKNFKQYLSIKIESRELTFLPNPKPYCEVFVYSTRMEGIHLRNARIARGGIRWSDRAEDFRTEILGLMKAQTVKNAVIVPSGAKGGFIVKNLPKSGDRAAIQAEGIACYQYLIKGLLDITDNYGRGNKVIKPKNVVCIDGDDPYLVVAADKGTATFSDIANALSIEYGFWMHDAFASGGSAGYDHKVMGITARGAWESVKRHFHERGGDTQTQPFDVLGIGDMAGDVFGNGMLLSPYIRLVGAFNHSHIFCDPAPDPKTTFAERQRLFKGVMGWDHYNTKLLSKGGRIFLRKDKVLDLTPEIQKRFDITKSRVSPPELITAILKSQVDLMYLGGIGTYVKASMETNSDAGDRSNDGLRVNADEIRAYVVGEGANLGFTQRARIEASEHGVLMNADFVDNSAGVDTSDHEVNLKILMSMIMERTKKEKAPLTFSARNKFLKSMTDDIAALVLSDNYQQTQAISLIRAQAADHLPEHQIFMQDLEKAGVLDRSLEFLPNDERIAKRLSARQGLTRPEIAILVSYAKIYLRDALLESDIPDRPELNSWLVGYFPRAIQKKYELDILKHPLKREITATIVSNILVNRLGPTFVRAMMTEWHVSAASVVRAFIAVCMIFDLPKIWSDIEALESVSDFNVQQLAFLEISKLVERMVDWFLSEQGDCIQIDKIIKNWKKQIEKYRDLLISDKTLKSVLSSVQYESYVKRFKYFSDAKVPNSLARFLAIRTKLAQAPGVLTLSQQSKKSLLDIAKIYIQIGDVFGLSSIRSGLDALERGDRWHKIAAQSLARELDHVQQGLASTVLSMAPSNKDDIDIWVQQGGAKGAESMMLIADMKRTGLKDLTMAMVLVQKIKSLI